jgi:hypothetical protein
MLSCKEPNMSSKWKYILQAALFWGSFMFLGLTVMDSWRNHWHIDWTGVIVRLIVFPLAGIAFGASMWHWNQRHPQKK